MSHGRALAVAVIGIMLLSAASAGVTGGSGIAQATQSSTLSSTTSSTAHINGTLTNTDGSNASNGKVLAGSNGTLVDTDSTSSSGNYSLDVASNTTYNVWYQQYSPDGNESNNFPRDGQADIYALGDPAVDTGTTNLDAKIPAGHLLEVQVVDSAGDPISNVEVNIVSYANGARAYAGGLTTSQGLFKLNGSDTTGIEVNGAVTVIVEGGDSYESKSIDLTVDSNQTKTITLQQTATVNGTVTTANGSAAAGTVQLFSETDGSQYPLDSSGSFSAELITNTSYRYAYYQGSSLDSAPADGVPDFYPIGTVSVKSDTTISTQLPTAHNLTVRVVRPDGTAVENATVRVYQVQDEAYAGGSDLTATNGEITTEVAGGLETHINVRPPDGSNLAEKRVTVTLSGDKTVTVELQETATVTGSIVDSTGDPVTGMRASYHTDDGIYKSANTGTDGTFSMGVPTNETYHVDLEQVGTSSTPAYPDDGVPGIYAYGFKDVGATNVSHSFTLPYGNDLNITVVGPDGTAVSDAQVRVTHINNDRGTSAWGTTTATGLFVPEGASDAGLEVNGTVRIHVTPPSGSNLGETTTKLTVDSNQSIKIQLQETVSVMGTVTDASGAAAENVRIFYDQVDTSYTHGTDVTDSRGQYSVSVIPNSTYEVHLTQEGLQSESFPDDGVPGVYAKTFTSIDGADTVRNYSLPQGYDLNITVERPNGSIVEYADVHVVHINSDDLNAGVGGQTNGNGMFVPRDATDPGIEVNGQIHISVRAPEGSGLADTTRELTVSNNTSVTVTLQKATEVTGQIYTADNQTVDSGRVTLEALDDSAYKSNHTGTNGTFSVTVPRGPEYAVGFIQTASDNEYEPSWTQDGVPDIYKLQTVNTTGKQTVQLGDVQLPKPHNLTVNVVYENGTPVENVRLWVNHGSGSESVGAQAYTNSSGTFTAEVIGQIGIYVNPVDSRELSENGTQLTVNSDREVTIVIQSSATVSGSVKYHDNTSAVGHIGLWSDDGGEGTWMDDGTFAIGVPRNNTYRLGFEQTDWDGPAENFPRDGNPDVYSFGQVQVNDSDVSLGTLGLPKAHLLNVTVVTTNGTELEGVPVTVEHINNNGSAYVHGATNANGLLVLNGANQPGVEVNGTVEVSVDPREAGMPYGYNATQVVVTSNDSIRIVVQKQITISGRTVDPTGNVLGGDIVVAQSENVWEVRRINSDGNFSVLINPNETTSIGWVEDGENKTLVPRNGRADLYEFSSSAYSSSTDIGNITIPDGHVLNVTVVDESGDPVEGATVVYKPDNAGGDRSDNFGFSMSTLEDGMTHLNGSLDRPTGLELSGDVILNITPPESGKYVDRHYVRNVTVNSAKGITVTLEERAKITVTGTIEEAGGAAAANDTIAVFTEHSSLAPAENGTVTASDGSYNVTLWANTSQDLQYYQIYDDTANRSVDLGANAFPRDGSVDIYALARVNASTDQTISQQLPEGHVVNVTVVDEDGNPVANASIHVSHINGDADAGWVARSNEAGMLNSSSAGPGLELAGNVSISVSPPANASWYVQQEYTRNLTVTDSENITITLQEKPLSDRDTAILSGNVTTPAGTSGKTAYVLIQGDTWNPVFTETGEFATELPVGDQYGVTIVDAKGANDSITVAPKNGIADLYYVGSVDLHENTSLGDISLPEGHAFNVTVVDSNGDPVENASVTVTAAPGVERASSLTFPTGSQGQMSLELNGTVQVMVEPPKNSTRFEVENVTRNYTVKGQRNVTIELDSGEPAFDVDYSVESDIVVSGSPINATATVTNTGNATGTKNVTFIIENAQTTAVAVTKSVTLKPGETKTVSFSETVSDGTWSVRVNELQQTKVTVAHPVQVNISTQKQVGKGRNVTAVVRISNVTQGVGAFDDLNVTLGNGTVLTIVEAQVVPSTGEKSTAIAPSADHVSFAGRFMNTSDTEPVLVAEVTMNASAVGTSQLTVSINTVSNENGLRYAVTQTGQDELEVVPVPTVGGFQVSPTNPDNDSQFEDVNGDGSFGIADVQALFAYQYSDTVQDYVEAFDFNNDGEISVLDVQALYYEYTQKGGA